MSKCEYIYFGGRLGTQFTLQSCRYSFTAPTSSNSKIPKPSIGIRSLALLITPTLCLTHAIGTSQVFEGFEEGELWFKPTYKYNTKPPFGMYVSDHSDLEKMADR